MGNYKTVSTLKHAAGLAVLLLMVSVFAPSCSRRGTIKSINKTITIAHRMPITTDSNPLDMIQGIYAFGPRYTITDAVTQEKIQALSFLGGSAAAATVNEDDNGPFFVEKVGDRLVEQHRNQFVGIVAFSGAKEDRGFISIDGNYYTLNDFLRRAIIDIDTSEMNDELVTGPEGNELGWTLVLLATANMTTTDWRNKNDKLESTEMILEKALERPVSWGSYSGLVEQLGIAVALRSYRQYRLEEDWAAYRASLDKEDSLQLPKPTLESVELAGVWKKAADHVDSVIETLEKNQMADGTFSASWYKETVEEEATNATDKVLYTGMALDFLAAAMNDSQLTEPWVMSCVKRLSKVIQDNRFQLYDEVVPLTHATHALAAFRDRLENRGKPYEPPKEFDDAMQPDRCCGE